MSLYIFDLDGVIYRGEKLLPYAKEILSFLRKRGEEISFLSNNSTLSRKGYFEKFERMGIKTKLKEIFPSSYLTRLYFTEDKKRKNSRLSVIGEEGLFKELKEAGLKILPLGEKADYVVVGMDRNLTFEKLSFAFQSILEGAKFIATNMDLTFPLEEKITPGAGAIVKSLEVSTGKTPLLIGKPETFGIKKIMRDKDYSAEETFLIGDRLDTDILAGKRAEVTTILVLSGITTLPEVKKAPIHLKPDYVIPDLNKLKAFPSVAIDAL